MNILLRGGNVVMIQGSRTEGDPQEEGSEREEIEKGISNILELNEEEERTKSLGKFMSKYQPKKGLPTLIEKYNPEQVKELVEVIFDNLSKSRKQQTRKARWILGATAAVVLLLFGGLATFISFPSPEW